MGGGGGIVPTPSLLGCGGILTGGGHGWGDFTPDAVLRAPPDPRHPTVR